MSKKILVVEDDEIPRKCLQNFSKNLNIEADLAENGTQGIEKVKSNTYDAIFIDLHMPDMEGDQTLAKMKETGKISGKLILMTADEMEIADVNKMGFDSYIQKPVKKKTFEEYINKL